MLRAVDLGERRVAGIARAAIDRPVDGGADRDRRGRREREQAEDDGK